MSYPERRQIKIAILDLYEGAANEGMRCIREIIQDWGASGRFEVSVTEFDVRLQKEVPELQYDIFISSGGPGSPLESEGSDWENNYFNWIKTVEDWNRNENNFPKKHIFFICHSFQLASRYFKIARVCKRKSTAFGVFPIHMLEEGSQERVFNGLRDPFYSVDSRDYQVIEPDHAQLKKMGGHILAIEKERPHVPLERAIMAIRFNEWFIGTQFHPEADAIGMAMYLQRADKKQTVIENHGEAKWQSMVEQLLDPEKITWTHDHVLSNFLNLASADKY
ncbi:MAG: GMP synthase [Sediminibacterium sp.]|nr:GMP synthase [Sediminibacterium sp.]